jgi:serine/threonine protein phosphatase PrpC
MAIPVEKMFDDILAPKENKYENEGTDNMTAILIRLNKKEKEKEIDVEGIAYAVVKHLSSETPYPEESSYESILELLRLYLKGKRLLTKAYNNKTKR